jgi:hypothetical protein
MNFSVSSQKVVGKTTTTKMNGNGFSLQHSLAKTNSNSSRRNHYLIDGDVTKCLSRALLLDAKDQIVTISQALLNKMF